MSIAADTMESITLRLENEAVLSFRGRLFSEAVWNDEESGVFTHHKLYVTDQNEHVYVIRKGGERCVIYNGRTVTELPLDMLLRAVRTLCGAEGGMVMEQIEETLRSASC